MSYAYDVFISYRHAGVIRDWVCNHFQPRLQEWLDAASPSPVSVFIDDDIETGSDLPEAVKIALARSKLLVPVYSPQYFSSAWCQTEFLTMVARLEHCGIPTAEDPTTLIVPVKFNDGEYFTEAACAFKYDDFSSFTYPNPAYAESVGYLEFTDRVKALAHTIITRLAIVPSWDPEWSIVEIAPDDPRLIPPPIALPSL